LIEGVRRVDRGTDPLEASGELQPAVKALVDADEVADAAAAAGLTRRRFGSWGISRGGSMDWQ
jgi:hypothetical protein